MNMRLLTTLIAAAALSGCATYDYAGGSGAGGYYYGRPSTEYYGPYGGAYGYPSYGYGSYYYGYGYRDPYGYYGGYYPYYPYYPHWPRPPRPPHTDPPDPPTDRAPAWRNPQDGRYRESGRVMIPPHNRSVAPTVPGQPQVRNPGVRQRVVDGEPRQMSQPAAPRAVERTRPVERAAPERRSENRDRVRTQEP